jgi:DNA-binding CsgD family transcriptional regulator
VLAVPIRGETSWIAQRRPAAVPFVTDPDRDGRVRTDELRRRFGLTRAETGFLSGIVKGDGLQAAADRLGVSLATVRTHLRHVFDKTGTLRQADSSAAPHRPTPYVPGSAAMLYDRMYAPVHLDGAGKCLTVCVTRPAASRI